MSYTLIYVAIVVAVLNWVAVAKKWTTFNYITKPGVMVVLLIWVCQLKHFPGRLWVFALALVFSLAGDVFLMLPGNFFLPGLIAFLLAHLAYIKGLLVVLPTTNLATLFVALLIGTTSYQIYRRVAKGLKRAGDEKMRLPLLVYTIVISVMVFSALSIVTRRSETLPSLLVSAGALLFYISDTWIAWDRFVEPLKYRRLRVMVSYHLGQILLILGAALMF
ncbi:MAG: lysoplasmalogenase [Chloroflexota bacterium]|nr:lysoplasmalogenase [Chloroflexota bacterium]